MSTRAEHSTAVLVVGGRGYAADLLAHALQANGVRLVSPGEMSDEDRLVLLLADAEPETWEVARRVDAPVVLVTGDEPPAEQVIDALLRGADAVVPASSDVDHVVNAIDVVADGGTVLSPTEARTLVTAARRRSREGDDAPVPTTRELEILRSIDRGESVKQTALALGIAAKTVENLQSRLFKKFGVRNRAQAVAFALSVGYLDSDA